MFLYILHFNVNFFRWTNKDAISVKVTKNHSKMKKEKQRNNNTGSDRITNQKEKDMYGSKMVPIQDLPAVQSVFLPQFKMFPSTLN